MFGRAKAAMNVGHDAVLTGIVSLYNVRARQKGTDTRIQYVPTEKILALRGIDTEDATERDLGHIDVLFGILPAMFGVCLLSYLSSAFQYWAAAETAPIAVIVVLTVLAVWSLQGLSYVTALRTEVAD